MAHDNKEVEIKIAVDKDIFFNVKEKLQNIAVFKKESSQIDTYYTPKHRNFIANDYPYEWISIRQRGNKNILNYKHFHPPGAKIHTHCDEFETEVSNAESLKKIFSALDFNNFVTVEKTRLAFLYKDEFEIALDDVKNLGYFIEVEALKDFGSIDLTRQKLFDFANSLGIDTSNPDERGYPYHLMKKKQI